jgi:hypothetical protein
VDDALTVTAIGGFFPPKGALPAGFFHSTMACRRDLALAIGYDRQVAFGAQPSWEAAEDRTLMLSLSSHYRGVFFPDVLTIYLANRDVSLRRSMASHRSAFRQMRHMIASGVLQPDLPQRMLLRISFWAKLMALSVFRFRPDWYPTARRMREPNFGKTSPGWAPSLERIDSIRNTCEFGSISSTQTQK